jgi:enolase
VPQTITDVDVWEGLDSRGDPTITARVDIGDSFGQALAPAGASAGRHEAVFLRDGGVEYAGRSVCALADRVRPQLRDALIGRDAADPDGLDAALRAVDETTSWSGIGGNVVTAVTVAAWLALADAEHREPWEVIAAWTGAEPVLPMPMVNVISGGAHAGRAIDIQDVLVIPRRAQTAAEAIETAWHVRAATRTVLERDGFQTALVADEGGLAAPFAQNADAIAAVHRAIRELDQTPGSQIGIALDVAATQFEETPGRYRLDGEVRTNVEIVDTLSEWCTRFGIVSLEDPLGEDDDWSSLRSMLTATQVIGDDRYATSVERLAQGIERHEANAVLIKPNQAGSLFGALRALLLARESGWATVVSARSGETEDDWLVDLAVGSGAGQLKVGSTMRSERTAKWNRLLTLAHRSNLPFAREDA